MSGSETEFTFRVRYAETDQMGTYYHARALEWFEVGRSELSEAMGLPYLEWERRGVFMPVIECHLKFGGRANYHDLLRMKVSVEIVGRTRLKFSNTVVQAESGARVCEGWTMHALINREGMPQRIPDWVEALVEGKASGDES